MSGLLLLDVYGCKRRKLNIKEAVVMSELKSIALAPERKKIKLEIVQNFDARLQIKTKDFIRPNRYAQLLDKARLFWN